MSDHDEVQRGQQAQMVLDNPAYTDAHDAMREALLRAMETAESMEVVVECRQMLKALTKVRSLMEATMRTGKVAADKIGKEQTMAERLARRFIGR